MKKSVFLLLVACSFLPLAVHAVADEVKRDPAIKSSKPVEKEGFSVTIAPAKAVFAPKEPLILVVTYKNISDKPMRLPPGFAEWNYWSVSLKEPSAKEALIGKFTLRMGRSGPGRASELIPPGKSISVTADLKRFGFTRGKWDRSHVSFELPEGKLAARLSIQMFPQADVGAKTNLWQVKEIDTGEATIEIRAAK